MEREYEQAKSMTTGEEIEAGTYKFIGSGKSRFLGDGTCVFDETACIYENNLKLRVPYL
jgi:hypothetical protein